MENMKTKSKLDQLKLVMQQKKERREARKLKTAPYNIAHHSAQHLGSIMPIATTNVPVPLVTSASSSPNSGIAASNSNHNRLNGDATTSAAINASISTDNHMEEVETVA
jgi:hypothetical protein